MHGLLKRFGINYEPLDTEGRILPSNPDFWNYLRLTVP